MTEQTSRTAARLREINALRLSVHLLSRRNVVKTVGFAWDWGLRVEEGEETTAGARERRDIIMALAAVSLYLLALAWTNLRPVHGNNRHAVYWNSSNIQ